MQKIEDMNHEQGFKKKKLNIYTTVKAKNKLQYAKKQCSITKKNNLSSLQEAALRKHFHQLQKKRRELLLKSFMSDYLNPKRLFSPNNIYYLVAQISQMSISVNYLVFYGKQLNMHLKHLLMAIHLITFFPSKYCKKLL